MADSLGQLIDVCITEVSLIRRAVMERFHSHFSTLHCTIKEKLYKTSLDGDSDQVQ